jgi:hypothetical protein
MPRFRLFEAAAAALALVGVLVDVGALPASSQAATAISAPPAVASASLTAPSARLGVGNVMASVPEVSFGVSDEVPVDLVSGQDYPMVVTVWVAPGSGPAVVRLSVGGAARASCPVVTINAGVAVIRCELSASSSATSLDIEASARLRDGGTIGHRYPHEVR